MAGYVVNSKQEQQHMLEELGLTTIEQLFQHIPQQARLQRELNIEDGLSEFEVMDKMQELANQNHVFKTIFRGAGSYRHYIPTIVNHLANRSEFVTSYTPYQAEVSQGTLQAIFEYQTMMARLTGMDASNASVYDGATAAAEAMMMAQERKRSTILVASTIHPSVRKVMQTYASGFDINLVEVKSEDGLIRVSDLEKVITDEIAGFYIEQVNYHGLIEDIKPLAEFCHQHDVKVIVGINPIAAAILPSAREIGADIAVGEGQALGIPLQFGGPSFGFMCTTSNYVRRLPGRIVGETTDKDGQRAYVLTLQAREQHIRREKATSSICSNQSLMAVRATIYLATVGPEGLKEIAWRCVDNAHYLAQQLSTIEGIELANTHEFFHEFVTKVNDSQKVLSKLQEHGILGGYPISETEILWCATEVNTKAEMDQVVSLIKEVN